LLELENYNAALYDPFIFTDGKMSKGRYPFNLTQVGKDFHEDQLEEIPFWKIKNTENIVLFCRGNGMWDEVWGFILVDPKSSKIKNICFNHKGETSGLGAEITSRFFEEQFIGRHMIGERIRIVRPHDDNSEKFNTVDGITGATMTCDGVDFMLQKAADVYSPLIGHKDFY